MWFSHNWRDNLLSSWWSLCRVHSTGQTILSCQFWKQNNSHNSKEREETRKGVFPPGFPERNNVTCSLTLNRFPPKTLILSWQFSILLLTWSGKDLKTIFKQKCSLSSKSHGCCSRLEMLQKREVFHNYLGYMQHFRRRAEQLCSNKH